MEQVKGENVLLDKSVDDEYVKLVERIAINNDLDKSNFKVVFTPNHGTSYVNAMRIFSDLGYKIYPVLSQIDPDPDFSGTLSPNPEDPRSFIEPINTPTNPARINMLQCVMCPLYKHSRPK